MNNSSKTIFVYDNFSSKEACLLGRLFVDLQRGSEIFSFEYDDEWLAKNRAGYFLDPDLTLYSGRQYPSKQSLFGLFADASPDRWGRMLMMKKERINAEKENRKPRKLLSSDFLLGVFDETRMGGLRFKLDPDADFVSNDSTFVVPPWVNLRSLEEASRNIEQDEFGKTERWLNQLLQPGSSLGGARPKATVQDQFGNLWIAKFPSKNDTNNTGAWEKVASDLARFCELNVPESKLENFSDLGSTFLVKRFDRDNERRIHFASAMTLLGKTDGASAIDGSSYLDIANFIKANGSRPNDDLKELWRRIVFSMAISNTDDHLRNHAFILEEHGWRLSPMFDVNPVPYGNELSLNVDENDNRISIGLAIDACTYFGLEKDEAKVIAKEITDTVSENWERLAKMHQLTRSQIENMRPAFMK